MEKDHFIKRATEVHGDKFDYSLLPDEFLSKSKIDIICPQHGVFSQTATDHTQGYGCKLCGIERSRLAKFKDKNHFVSRAIQVHGNKYDYSKVKYLSAKTSVVISCKVHGDFNQEPNSHLNGRGCPACGLLKIGDVKRKDVDTFIHQARLVHGDKYSYSGEYTNTMTPVNIFCKEHGHFSQTPDNHLSGQGCPSCAMYGYDPKLPCTFYLNAVGNNNLKFGITRSLTKRIKTQDRKSNFSVSNILSINFEYGYQARELESTLKSELVCGSLSKEEMPDGYTETVRVDSLDYFYDVLLEFFINNTF